MDGDGKSILLECGRIKVLPSDYCSVLFAAERPAPGLRL